MRAVAVAMTTEYCRRGWRPALSLLFVAVALLTGLACTADLRRYDWGVFYSFWGITFQYCAIIVFTAQCDPIQAASRCHFCLPRRLYTLPVPTWAMVGWQMLLGMVTSGFMYVVLAGLSNSLLDMRWPVWIPAQVFAVATAVVQAGMWTLVRTPLLQVAFGCSVWIGLLAWTHIRRAITDPVDPAELWARLSAGEWLTVLSLGVGAYVVAVIGVASDRRGAPGTLMRLCTLWRQLTAQTGNRSRAKSAWSGQPRFRSQSAAQFWMERRRMAVGRPSLLLLGLWPVAIVLASFFHHVGVWSVQTALVVIGSTMSLAVTTQLAIVAYGTVRGVRDPSSFFATLPTTNVAWSRAVLKTNVTSAVMTFFVTSIIVTVSILALSSVFERGFTDGGLTDDDGGLVRFWRLWWDPLTLVGVLLFHWTLQGLAWPIKDFARRTRFWTLLNLIGLPPVFVVCVANAELRFGWITPETATRLLQCAAAVLGIAALTWTAIAFRTAYRCRLIGPRAIVAAVGVWLVLCLIPAIGCSVDRFFDAAEVVFWVGLLSLPTAPWAAVPLSLARSRHR